MRTVLRAIAASLALTGAVVATASPTAAQEVAVERATIVDGSGAALRGGGSRDPFTLGLPDGASCPGDSADEDYRVNTYMVPAEEDPAAVTYDGLGPTPKVHGRREGFRQPLYDVSSTFVVSQLTEDAAEPGEPGRIVALPMLDFAVYAPGDLPAGSYRVGVTCTRRNEVVRVWDAAMRIVDDETDEPAGIRWEVVGFVPDSGDGGDSRVPVLLGAAAAAAVVVAFVLHRRRRPPARTSAPREGTRW